MITFRQLTPKSSPSHPTQGYYPHLLAHGCGPAAFSMLIVPCPHKGGSPSSKDYCASNSVILQATSVYRAPKTRHVTSTVQQLIKGIQRTGLNRHRRGYATKEAGSTIHFLVSGPIGLARSHILISQFIIIISYHKYQQTFIKDLPILQH